MIDRIKAKENAKTLLRERSFFDYAGMLLILFIKVFSVFMGAFVVFGIFTFVASLINIIGISSLALGGPLAAYYGLFRATTTTLLVGMLVSLLVILVFGSISSYSQLLFHTGMIRSSFRMNRGDKNVRVIDTVLAGDQLGRRISILLWQILFYFLWNLPSLVGLILGNILIYHHYSSGGSTPAVVFAIILYVLSIGWSLFITLYKWMQYFFSYHVAEEKRDLYSLDCIQESCRLTENRKLELFAMVLSFIGWDVIGGFYAAPFVVPYKYLAFTSVYEQLTEQFQPIPRNQMAWADNRPLSAPAKSNAPSGIRRIEIISGEYNGTNIDMKPGDDITIGRDPKRANVVAQNAAISGLHCRIRYDDSLSKYIVFDYSINGTYVNNERLAPEKGVYANRGSIVKLADGAMILKLA